MKSLYLWINILTLAFPLLASFEKRVHFVGWWKHLLPSMGVTALFFIAWDALFTRLGVWGFNDAYTLGFRISELPIEEILFFITVPYSSLFIYAVLQYAQPNTTKWDSIAPTITKIVCAVLVVVAAIYHTNFYTAGTILVAVLLLAYTLWIKAPYMGAFYRFYLWHLIPFIIVNGILTGYLTPEPVVWYNSNHIIGVRIGTIPIEDTVYSCALMLLTVIQMEQRKQRNTQLT